jgi:hypothetical protein
MSGKTHITEIAAMSEVSEQGQGSDTLHFYLPKTYSNTDYEQ